MISETVHRLKARIDLIQALNDSDKIAESAIKLVRDGGCICVLMNTVREAQEVYDSIKKKYSGDLLLFHAQFALERRAELEQICILRYGKDKTRRPQQSILVATQVVEQSLDVDFDAMITAIAPVDLLIQRLGRVHRHAYSGRPKALSEPSLSVLIPKEFQGYGPSSFVYPECLLDSSIRCLHEKTEIRIPEDIAEIVKRGYSSEFVPQDKLHEFMEYHIQLQVDAGAAQQYTIGPPEKQYSALADSFLYDDDSNVMSVATRLGEPSVRIAMIDDGLFKKLEPCICTNSNGEICAEVWSKSLAEEIMLKSFSIQSNRIGNVLPDGHAVRGAKLLSGVWILHTADRQYTFADGKRIINDPELGIIIEKGEK